MLLSRFTAMLPAWLLGFVACAGLIGYALFVEHVQHILPCPLCVFQRVAFIAMGVVFLVGGLHAPRGWGRRVYGGLLALCALGGIGVSWRHLWLQSLPPDQVPSCGPGLSYMMDAFPFMQAMKMVFTGSGECAEVNWSFLGLSMPAWALMAYVILAAWGLWTARRTRPAAIRS